MIIIYSHTKNKVFGGSLYFLSEEEAIKSGLKTANLQGTPVVVTRSVIASAPIPELIVSLLNHEELVVESSEDIITCEVDWRKTP